MIELSAAPAVEWLLQSADPSVRYLTLTEIVGKSSGDSVARTLKRNIAESPKVHALLSGQRSDGGFGVHPYRKWTGGFWRLVALAELATPSSHPGIRPLVDHVLKWLMGEARTASATNIKGRVRAHATQDGYALAALCLLGLARQRKAQRIAQSLVAWQWPDGGWNCDRSFTTTHSSLHETHGPLWGLAEFFRRTKDPAAGHSAERGAEFLLRHRLFRSEHTNRTIHSSLVKLRFPPYWHYDVLQGLWVLSRLDMTRDPRAAESLDVLERKRRSDGLWRCEGYWWKPPGTVGSNVEVVDWGRRGPNEWVTLRALRVLKSAGRAGHRSHRDPRLDSLGVAERET